MIYVIQNKKTFLKYYCVFFIITQIVHLLKLLKLGKLILHNLFLKELIKLGV